MKKSINFLLCLTLALSSLAACTEPTPSSGNKPNSNSTPVHEHSYATEWSHDENNHWKECECGDKSENAAHAYAAEWLHDAENHWKECECGAKSENAAHADENNDGVCDGCEWNYDHEHTYSKDWTVGENGHYHEVTCGHDVPGTAEEDHVEDIAGECEYCDLVMGEPIAIEDVETAVEMGVVQADKVKSGTILKSIGGYYGDTITNIDYNITDDYTYVKAVEQGDYGSTYEYFVSCVGENYLMVVDNPTTDWEGNPVVNTEIRNNVVAENMNGWETNFDFIGNPENMVAYGVADMVDQLYGMGCTYEGFMAEMMPNEEGFMETFETDAMMYAFMYSFDNVYYNEWSDAWYGDYYTVTVIFTLGESNEINKAIVQVSQYGDSEDLWTVEETEDGVVVTLADGAVPTYEHIIFATQSTEAAAEVPENKYPAAELLATDYEVVNEDGSALTDNVINVTIGTPTYVHVNFTPENALGDYNEMSFTLDGEEVTWESPVSCTFSPKIIDYATDEVTEQARVIINGKDGKTGSYEVTFSCAGIEKVYTIVVVAPAPTEIKVGFGEYKDTAATQSTYTGVDVAITAVVNQYADNAYTATLTGEGATLTLDEETGDYVFNATAAGEYTITVTSTIDPTLTASTVVTVEAAPEVKDILNGGWSNSNWEVTFTPASAGAVNGQVSVTRVDGWGSKHTAEYTYVYEDGTIKTTLASGEDQYITLSVNEAYGVSISSVYGNGDLKPVVPLAGQYRVYNGNKEPRYMMTLNADGTGVLTKANYNANNWTWTAEAEITFSWTVEEVEGEYVLTVSNVVDSMTTEGAVALSTLFDASSVTYIAEYEWSDDYGSYTDACISYTLDGVTVYGTWYE